MQRFVLLRHECPPTWKKPSHWDLMLEQAGVLKTWELSHLPEQWSHQLGAPAISTTDTVVVRELPDHRLDYLDYQGPLSGNRGHVQRCDDGTYEVLSHDEGHWEISLLGVALQSVVRLARCGTDWQLLFPS